MRKREILKVLTRLNVEYSHDAGDWCMAHCPLAPFSPEHPKARDSNAGMGIHIVDDNVTIAHCFTCKWKGTLGGLAIKLGGYLDEPELRDFGVDLDRKEMLGGTDIDFGEWDDTPERKAEKPFKPTKFPNERKFTDRFRSVLAFPEAIRYLRRRNIDFSTCIRLNLRFDERQWRVLFPVYDYWTGRFAGCSGRAILEPAEYYARTGANPDEDEYPKVRDYAGLQKDRVLLGAHRVKRSIARGAGQRSPVIACEGLFAYARLSSLGLGDRSVALLGSECLPPKAKIIADMGAPLYWFTDDDPAGHACLYGRWDKDAGAHNGKGALHKLYGLVPQFVPIWPEGKNDPDDLTRLEVDEMIDNAEFYLIG